MSWRETEREFSLVEVERKATARFEIVRVDHPMSVSCVRFHSQNEYENDPLPLHRSFSQCNRSFLLIRCRIRSQKENHFWTLFLTNDLQASWFHPFSKHRTMFFDVGSNRRYNPSSIDVAEGKGSGTSEHEEEFHRRIRKDRRNVDVHVSIEREAFVMETLCP